VIDGRRRVALIAIGLVAPAALLIAGLAAAWPVTIDDAYISYRYARNLVRGFGLVYNPGEAIEGYTNFLWTVMAAGAIKLHLDPELATKLLGSASALGTLGVAWRVSARLQPVRVLPPLAPWLLASSALCAGYAVMGLETIFFAFLVALGTWLLFEEAEAAPPRFPWSGVVFALAALTRPEAPLFLAIAVAALGRRACSRQNAVRLAIVVAVACAHLLWRHQTYGAWLPNTLAAKTGNMGGQVTSGLDYMGRYARQCGPVLWLMTAVGAVLVVRRRSALGIAVAASALGVAAYTTVVGGDWMPLWRFLAPLEPFAFVLADVGFRAAAESSPDAPAPRPLSRAGRRVRAVSWAALAIVAVVVGVQRAQARHAQLAELAAEQRGWDISAHPLADWLTANQPPGLIAVGDIGYIGWRTDFPVLDILGLVDPVIATLPGGYGTKQGPAYLDYFFRRRPAYFVLISDHGDCRHPFHPSIAAVYRAPERRFKNSYRVVHRVAVHDGYGWCVYAYAPRGPAVRERTVFDFEAGFAGWQATGTAFERGPSSFAPPNQQPITGAEGQSLANSFHPALGDDAVGTLTSPAFALDRGQLTLLVGGGASNDTRVELVVDGRPVLSASGVESEDMSPVSWDVTAFAGRSAQLRIVDAATGPWGHVLLDAVKLSDPG